MADKVRKMKDRISAYGFRNAAFAAADRILGRSSHEISYEQWQEKNRLSSRDYTKMSRQTLPWMPTFAVHAYAEGRDRAALLQSLSLQIYRNFHPLKDYPDAEYTLLCGEGCSLAPDLLWQCARYLGSIHSKPALIYFDSDVIGQEGRKTSPAFRPDYDADLLERVNYMGNVVLVKTAAARNAGFPGAGEESFYAFLKRVCQSHDVKAGQEAHGAIRHIPKVLFHETVKTASDIAESAGCAGDAAPPDSVGGEETKTDTLPQEDNTPLVTVIIPSKDHKEDLARCIVSLQHINTWKNLEILIIENNSEQKATFEFYEELQKSDSRIHVLVYDGPFNYSEINNFAVSKASGDLILFLNNDTAVLARDSIKKMALLAVRQEVGAVGAVLLYPDHTVQHGGIILGYGGVAGHAFSGELESAMNGTYPGLVFQNVHNVCAVTGACMMVRKNTFLDLGGFDENLSVTFNDVDFCLRLREKGFRVLMCPEARLIHNESASRGSEDSHDKINRFHDEVRLFVKRWKRQLEEGDPFYNPNLTLTGRTWTCVDTRRETAKPYLKYLDL